MSHDPVAVLLCLKSKLETEDEGTLDHSIVQGAIDEIERLTTENSALIAKFRNVLVACGMDGKAANALVEGVINDVTDTRRRAWRCPMCQEKSDDDGVVRTHKKTCCHYGSALAPTAVATASGNQR